jgi:hypothetical protein
MKFPSLKYMATYGIYSVKDLYAKRVIVNETLDKECSKCAFVHNETHCSNCQLKN